MEKSCSYPNTTCSVLQQEQITIGVGGHESMREPAKPGGGCLDNAKAEPVVADSTNSSAFFVVASLRPTIPLLQVSDCVALTAQ